MYCWDIACTRAAKRSGKLDSYSAVKSSRTTNFKSMATREQEETLRSLDELSLSTSRRRSITEKYDVVVAIDFGTTFSGFAFSFNHRDGSDDIYMNREWGSAQGFCTLKTPTCILLNPYKKFVKFGFEAAEKYAELEDAKDQTFYCFDRFKMMLHKSEVSRLET